MSENVGGTESRRIICRRCLISDMEDDEHKAELFASVSDYIRSIPDETRCDESLYRQRLDICRSCDELFDGMCRLCGCFAEVRAVKRTGFCPHTAHKW
ncbi:MAG: DUF6171 family protein [Firmicutes bacterium]|nr:DUF6171 family protein [Bacillota bacterium]MCD7747626.1 DUF6171 family protein [Bacillota bacterium]MCD8311216.1 DUF6171 family protein [Bacillota bacterium]MCD8314922.1 DUF6171 family protein [Bacillota bacterium]